jgi:DNA-directed RNA polymerase subunit F
MLRLTAAHTLNGSSSSDFPFCFLRAVLSNAQVAMILQVSTTSAVNRDEELNEVYRSTQKYVNRFNTLTNPEKEQQELVDELDNLQE